MSRTYWKDREAENLKRNKLSEKKYKAEVESIYAKMLDSIESEINAFYGKYAAKEDITIAEAKKRVSKLDIEAYERKAKKYVKDKNLSKQANEEMRLYNLTMKINRLEMLKSRIGLELISGFDELEKFMADILKGRTQDELERQAGILGNSVTESANFGKKVDSIVNASFHNATFSQRIWAHQDLLKLELDKQLKQGLIQGKGARDLARNIRDACNASMRNAERLMITELARVQIEAQKLSYKENGFEMYEFISEPTACPICKDLDGKHFEVEKMMPGENAAPMHPYCRCSTAPYSDRKEFDEWMNRLGEGETTEQWERLHKEKWRQQNPIKDKKRTEEEKARDLLEYKKFRNRKSDADMFKRYSKALGDLSPKTLEAFKEIKYNDPKEWRRLKEKYRVINMYKIDRGVFSVEEILNMDFDLIKDKRNNFTSKHKKSGNIAAVKIDNRKGYIIAHSQINDDSDRNGYKGNNHLVQLKPNRHYDYIGVIGSDGEIRKNTYVDTEAKIFEYLSDLYRESPFTMVTLLSERGMCDSCKYVMKQFIEEHPDVEVRAVSNRKVNGNVWKRRLEKNGRR